MKKLLIMISIMCSLGLIVSTALAVTASVQGGNASSNGQKSGNQLTNVPQAQIDRVKKREEMNKRREKLLKMRQQLIQSNNPGNVDGQAKN